MGRLSQLLLLALLVFPAALLLGGARGGAGESGSVRGGERPLLPEGRRAAVAAGGGVGSGNGH